MREAYARGVEAWSEAMEELVGSDEFAAGSGRMLALYAQHQEAVRTAAKLAAESVHMPTSEDLAAVARLVVNVERKVDDLSEAALGLGALDARLAAVESALGRIDAIEKAVAGIPAATAAGLEERLGAIEAAVAGIRADAPAPAKPAARKPAGKEDEKPSDKPAGKSSPRRTAAKGTRTRTSAAKAADDA
ncbi:MAG: hypothetical protein RIB67_06320 [Miltoncostaeaceae bacterium]